MNTITTTAAINAAIEQLSLDKRDILSVDTKFDGAFYEIELSTSYQHYDLYVDACTSELMGISAEPVIDDGAYEQGPVYRAADRYAAA